MGGVFSFVIHLLHIPSQKLMVYTTFRLKCQHPLTTYVKSYSGRALRDRLFRARDDSHLIFEFHNSKHIVGIMPTLAPRLIKALREEIGFLRSNADAMRCSYRTIPKVEQLRQFRFELSAFRRSPAPRPHPRPLPRSFSLVLGLPLCMLASCCPTPRFTMVASCLRSASVTLDEDLAITFPFALVYG